MKTTLRRIIFGSALAGLFTTTLACAPTIYVHPTKGPREFAADSVRCHAIARQGAGPWDQYGIMHAQLYPQCLYGEGWSRASR